MTVHDPFPGITGMPWWAVGLLAFFGISLAVLIAMVIGAEHEDGDLIPLNAAAERRVRERYEAEIAAAKQSIENWFPKAVAALCGPCNGEPGTTCICKDKCPNPMCGADDTVVSDLIGELETMLRREGDGQ